MTCKAPFQCSLQSHVVNVSVCAEFVLAELQEEQAAAAAAAADAARFEKYEEFKHVR